MAGSVTEEKVLFMNKVTANEHLSMSSNAHMQSSGCRGFLKEEYNYIVREQPFSGKVLRF